MISSDYQSLAMRTKGQYDTTREQITCAVLGINGEAGEVAEVVKKAYFQGHEFDRDKLIKEAGDVMWYLALLADALGTTLDRIATENVVKLEKRYPLKFDPIKSIDRVED